MREYQEMQTPNKVSRVRFVLCDPSLPANIGAAARAIKTMGFRDLWVVNPKHPDYREHPDAIALSTSSVDVLRESHSVRSPDRGTPVRGFPRLRFPRV